MIYSTMFLNYLVARKIKFIYLTGKGRKDFKNITPLISDPISWCYDPRRDRIPIVIKTNERIKVK